MLGLESEIGAVEIGRNADLVILTQDPRQDIHALADVVYTVKGGVAKTPEAWLAPPPVSVQSRDVWFSAK